MPFKNEIKGCFSLQKYKQSNIERLEIENENPKQKEFK